MGLGGSKKLQDFFTDAKIPKEQRCRIPLLCDQEKICWVTGCRLDDRVKITAQTQRVLIVEMRVGT
jgi:tRNA(Ile)-lysidine synthase